MADKSVSIGVIDPENDENLSLTFKHVTKVDCNEELDGDSTDTFDGPVVRGTENPGFTIDISQLDLESADSDMNAMERYALLKKILRIMRNTKGTLSVSEVSSLFILSEVSVLISSAGFSSLSLAGSLPVCSVLASSALSALRADDMLPL